MSFMNKELSDDLLPFSGKLSERFYEVRENVAGFCAEIEKIGAQLGSLPTRRPPLAHTAATHPRRQKRRVRNLAISSRRRPRRVTMVVAGMGGYE